MFAFICTQSHQSRLLPSLTQTCPQNTVLMAYHQFIFWALCCKKFIWIWVWLPRIWTFLLWSFLPLDDHYLSLQVKREAGDVSILVNNAGIVTGKKFMDAPDSLIEKTVEVNTMAHFWVGNCSSSFLSRFMTSALEWVKCRNHCALSTTKCLMYWDNKSLFCLFLSFVYESWQLNIESIKNEYNWFEH